MIVAAEIPNPLDWAADTVAGFAGDAASAGFEVLVGGLTTWVLDAVVWAVGRVFAFFVDAADPDVQADWFVGAGGPYATTAAVGATLMVVFLLAGIAQGVLTGDVAGMGRQMVLHLPLSVLGMVGIVTFTQVTVAVTDALATAVLRGFDSDVVAFTAVVGSVGGLSGGTASAFVVFLLGLVAVLAGVVLVAELVVRSALVYIVVALAPLVFAAQVWPAMRGGSRRLLELLAALILSKLVIAVALTVAAAAAGGVGAGGAVTALPTPEVVAGDPDGSVTRAVGILLSAAAAFGVAAFSPMLVAKLLPLTEAALVAQGVRGGPGRAAQTAMSLSSYRHSSGARLNQVAAGSVGPGSGTAAGAAGAGSGAAPVAAAGTGVTAASAARAATRTVGEGATAPANPAPSRSASQRPRPRRPPTSGPGPAGGDDAG